MNNLKELQNITKHLNLLIVDDEDIVRAFFVDALSPYFCKVFQGTDGSMGIDMFSAESIDLVISDQKMPLMTGLDMVKEIRKKNREVPVMLITAFTDTEILLEAINVGVNQFLVKPVRIDALYRAVHSCLVNVITKRQKLLEQEAEILKYKGHYFEMQQKLTLMKQQVLIRDDLYLKKMTPTTDNSLPSFRYSEWLIGVSHEPLDTLSGDFYSVRRINPDTALIFVADAMGKGLSAFVSSSIITAFLNHSIDRAIEQGGCNLQRLLNEFIDYSRKQFTRDEALCALFVLLDLQEGICSIANYGMPPLLVETESGDVLKIVSDGLPITKTFREGAIRRLPLERIKKMLLMTDGIYEPSREECLIEDFRASYFTRRLNKRLIARDNKIEDDRTFIFIRRIHKSIQWEKTLTLQSKIGHLNAAIDEIETILLNRDISEQQTAKVVSALSEMLLNAYEHGSISMGRILKNKLLKDNKYEDFIKAKEAETNKKITIGMEEFMENKETYLALCVRDEGLGFDTSIIRDSTVNAEDMLNYRGIKITSQLTDEIIYNEQGNEVTLIVTL